LNLRAYLKRMIWMAKLGKPNKKQRERVGVKWHKKMICLSPTWKIINPLRMQITITVQIWSRMDLIKNLTPTNKSQKIVRKMKSQR